MLYLYVYDLFVTVVGTSCMELFYVQVLVLI